MSAAQSQVDLLTKQRRTITAQMEQLRSMFSAPGLFDDVDLEDDRSDQIKAAAYPTEKIGSKEELEKLKAAEGSAQKKSGTSGKDNKTDEQGDKPAASGQQAAKQSAGQSSDAKTAQAKSAGPQPDNKKNGQVGGPSQAKNPNS